jgi:hypothetical protein
MQNNLMGGVPSALFPQQLYPQHVKLANVIQTHLQCLIMHAANLANQNQISPSPQIQAELSQCQNQIGQLQKQFLNQKSICVALKGLNLVEGQIQNLNNQIGKLIGQPTGEGPAFGLGSGEGPTYGLGSGFGQIPTNLQQTVCGLQLKLLACCKIRNQCCAQLCQALTSCNNTVPSSNLVPSYLIPTYLQGVQLPSPQEELSACQQQLTANKLRFGQQYALTTSLCGQLPSGLAITPSQVRSQCNNLVSNLFPQLQNQAQTSCMNEMQNNLIQPIPSNLIPSNLYPGHLSLCSQLKTQLQAQLLKAAYLTSQIQQSPTPELQNELTSCQNLANQLQNQFNNQKSICIALKANQLLQNKINNLQQQIGELMAPYNNLESGGTIPTSVQNQCCNLQCQILACCKLRQQCCVQLCQAVSQCNNSLPSGLIMPTASFVLPTPQQELSSCLQFTTANALQVGQQQSLCNALGARLNITPSQIESQCQNALEGLQPQILGQAQSLCSNELQNALRGGIPTRLLPENAYPLAVQRAAQVRFQLQTALNNLAGQGLSPSVPFSELAPQLSACNNLQNQYQNLKGIANLYKVISLCENQLPQLVGQVNRLVPNQVGYLVPESIPENIRPQVYGLQKRIFALINLERQAATQLATAYSPYGPSALQGEGTGPNNLSPAYSSCVNLICVLQCQHELQGPMVQNLGSFLPNKLTPAQVTSECNNELEGMRPNLYGQAESECGPALEGQFNKLMGPTTIPVALQNLNTKLGLQLVLCNNIQNQIGQNQNAINGLGNGPAFIPIRNRLNNIGVQLQNRLNAENQNCNMIRALIQVQKLIGQISPQVATQPSELSFYTPSNLQNQAKLAYLGNLQYLCNVNLANNLQQGIQALSNCANEYANLANNAPSNIYAQQFALQHQACKTALSQCQNEFNGLANVQIPQAHLNFN